MKNTALKIALAAVLTSSLTGCTYDSKAYPRESWFGTDTVPISGNDFTKAENPLPVSLAVTYLWEGQPVDEARRDWHERYGLWLASKRYLEETGLVRIVEEEAGNGTGGNTPGDNTAGQLTIVVNRSLSERTKQALARPQEKNAPEKVVYVYDTALAMELVLKDGKRFASRSLTDSMYIGHEDPEKRKTGSAPERFDFSFFNNMDFHTEFVRRFYRQMLFEALTELEKKRAFRSPGKNRVVLKD